MAQLAYMCEEVAERDRSVAVAGREGGPSLSLFAQSDAARAIMAEDAASAGLQVRTARSLTSLHENGGGVLGDIVLVECGQVDAALMAALIRLDERAQRSGAQLVVSTTQDALEDVFGCLDRSNPHILVAPSRAERLVALGAALVEVAGSRVRELDEHDRQALLHLTQEVTRLAKKLEGLGHSHAQVTAHKIAVGVKSPVIGFTHGDAQGEPQRKSRPPLPDPRLIKQIIARRHARARYFDAGLFADPAWDILLDLTAARAEHRRVSVTSLCIAANVPTTTALRWIAQMVDSGILERVQDDTDRRRAFIALSDNSADAMARYFDEVGQEAALPG